jgi:hypothetical protein
MRTHRYRPRCDELESRALLSALPIADQAVVYFSDYGGITPAETRTAGALGGSTQVVVNGVMTISPASPNLGQPFDATLGTKTYPNAGVKATTWTYTISYGGYTTPSKEGNAGYLSSSFIASIPGIYTIRADTSYTSTNPAVPPPPDTISTAKVNVPVPTTAAKTLTGASSPVTFGSTLQVVDTISTGLGPVGPWTTVTMQEDIPQVHWWNGTVTAGTNGWVPAAPNPGFELMQGKLYDAIGPTQFGLTPAEWNSAPIGYLGSFTQQLRAVWTMSGSKTPGGPITNEQFCVTLNSLTWTFSKVSSMQWRAQ